MSLMDDDDGRGGGRGGENGPNPDRRNWKEVEPLDPQSFPHPPPKGRGLPGTIANYEFLLASYDVTVCYDVIRKRLHIGSDWIEEGLVDNAANAALAHVISLAALNGLPRGDLETYLEAIGNSRPRNAIKDWILGTPWDGVDRLPAIYATLETAEHFSKYLQPILIRKWLLSATAAALKSGFRSRGVLTLQGAQGIGKTSWFRSLVPVPELQDWAVRIDHHMDAHNKDSILGGITCWICEIGELDSAMKKDVARIKGVLTRESDKVRRPYGKGESEMPRRTVFGASVNHAQFLSDDTGNSRFWVLPLTRVDHEHRVDMQQLFAQLAVELENGAEWWLDENEEALLYTENRSHRTVSAVAELVLDSLDLEPGDHTRLTALTPRQLLLVLGVPNPTNVQCKECGAVLREYVGSPKRIQGRDRWRVPLKLQFNGAAKEHTKDIDDD